MSWWSWLIIWTIVSTSIAIFIGKYIKFGLGGSDEDQT